MPEDSLRLFVLPEKRTHVLFTRMVNMKTRHRSAIELLMSHPDSTVAEMLGIRLTTLRNWLHDPKFAQALRTREKEQKASAGRIARQAAINAAATLCQAVSDPLKPDVKALLEVLKASGAFEAELEDSGEALSDLIRQAAKMEEERIARDT